MPLGDGDLLRLPAAPADARYVSLVVDDRWSSTFDFSPRCSDRTLRAGIVGPDGSGHPNRILTARLSEEIIAIRCSLAEARLRRTAKVLSRP